jgi:hypothetical protein
MTQALERFACSCHLKYANKFVSAFLIRREDEDGRTLALKDVVMIYYFQEFRILKHKLKLWVFLRFQAFFAQSTCCERIMWTWISPIRHMQSAIAFDGSIWNLTFEVYTKFFCIFFIFISIVPTQILPYMKLDSKSNMFIRKETS